MSEQETEAQSHQCIVLRPCRKHWHIPKALTGKNSIKGLFTEMLAGCKEFTRDGEHQGTCKYGKSLPLSGLKEKQRGNCMPGASERYSQGKFHFCSSLPRGSQTKIRPEKGAVVIQSAVVTSCILEQYRAEWERSRGYAADGLCAKPEASCSH